MGVVPWVFLYVLSTGANERSQPCGQRREDLVIWAKEILALYEYEIGGGTAALV